MDETLVLASGSPRRHELLTMAGVRHMVDVPEIDETALAGESADAYTARLARAKAAAVAARHPGFWTLGADTVVVVDGRIVGKPGDAAEAEMMLEAMAGRRHEVITAVALVRGSVVEERSSTTSVWMRPFDREIIRSYVATGEPMDKAGAYAAQGVGTILIDHIDGDFFTIMGLPLNAVMEMLRSVEFEAV
ncbi:MAG: septum formation inhibitor Maf [Gammaproteobacteria bacterium]|nr:septum formation inhibitor Maf [Gammaproteobacteria bacterium]